MGKFSMNLLYWTQFWSYRQRKFGLVDCQSEALFVQELKVTKTLWDAMQNQHRSKEVFSQWFHEKQAAKIWYGYGRPFRMTGTVHTLML